MRSGDMIAARYRVESELGRGGFAAVYAALDTLSGERVAVKVLTPDRDGGHRVDTRARFARELAILGQLSNPHTVRLLGHSATDDNLLFAVFELIDGQDLARIGRRLSPSEIVHVARQVLFSLHEAHSAGLVHRDIKPENIRILEHNQDPLYVKLLDFGIARSTGEGGGSVTRTGELIGTPRYMSPEQLMGKPLTPASDVYGVGMVMLEMLVGREAMAGNRLTDQLERLQEPHAFEAALGGQHANLVAVIKRMTALDVTRRYQSAISVIAALDGEPTQFDAPTDRRNLTSVFLVIAGVVLFVVAAAWLLPSDEEPSPRVVKQVAPYSLLRRAKPPQPQMESAPAPDLGPDLVRLPSGCGNTFELDAGSKFKGEYVSIPENFDNQTPTPFIVLLHANGQRPSSLRTHTGLNKRGQRQAIVCNPLDGQPLPFGDKTLLSGVWLDEDDYDRVSQTIDKISAGLCVDRERIFVIGNGAGGGLASDLMCAPAVTAVAINGFAYRQDVDPFVCDVPKPVIWFAARDELTADGHRLAARDHMSVTEIEEAIIARNKCQGPAIETKHAGGTCRTWTCEVPFESCMLDGGHAWPPGDSPGFEEEVFGEPGPFDVMAETWHFFDQLSQTTEQR